MGLKILVDLFDVLCISVVYISYNMGNRDLPDIYMLMPSGLQPSGLGIYIRQIPLAYVITYTYIIYMYHVHSLLQREIPWYITGAFEINHDWPWFILNVP